MRTLQRFALCVVAVTLLTSCAPSGLNPTAKPVKITDTGKILGSYSLKGTNPGHSAGYYVGTVTISDDGSGGVQVTQKIQGETWVGQGNIDPQGRLFVLFQEMNVEGTWTLLEDGQFKGVWKHREQGETGTEVWSP